MGILKLYMNFNMNINDFNDDKLKNKILQDIENNINKSDKIVEGSKEKYGIHLTAEEIEENRRWEEEEAETDRLLALEKKEKEEKLAKEKKLKKKKKKQESQKNAEEKTKFEKEQQLVREKELAEEDLSEVKKHIEKQKLEKQKNVTTSINYESSSI